MNERVLGMVTLIDAMLKKQSNGEHYIQHFKELPKYCMQYPLVEEGEAKWGSIMLKHNCITQALFHSKLDAKRKGPTTCHGYNITKYPLQDRQWHPDVKKAHICTLCYNSSELKACRYSTLWCQKKKALENYRFKKDTGQKVYKQGSLDKTRQHARHEQPQN